MAGISVVIPIGPNPAYQQWVQEAIESVLQQTFLPKEILLLGDGSRVGFKELCTWLNYDRIEPSAKYIVGKGTFTYRISPSEIVSLSTYNAPCRLGVAAIFNVGVTLADHDCVFMLGSDDKMMPTCLEECSRAYEKNNEEDAWYNVTIVTSSGEEHWIPNHTAMVTQGLFRWFEQGNGYFGFPPSAGVGGPDALLLSILMKHAPEKIVQVKQDTPLVWLREHEHQATHSDASYFLEEMNSIRNKETERFKCKSTR